MILIIFYICFGFFAIFMSLTLIGLFVRPPACRTDHPQVSVIIPARDEAHHLPGCIDALLKLDYPADKLEIIFINDRSSDRTESILRKTTQTYQHIKVVNVSQKPKQKTGKSQALIEGVKASRGQWLFFTDADCLVPSKWIQSTLKYSSDTGMIGGPVLMRGRNRESLFSRIQALDWLFFCAMGAAWSALKMPLSLFGNNMAVRRDVYEKSGGFAQVKNHITEDFALMRNVQKTKSRIRFTLHPGMLVRSFACDSWKEFSLQRMRWARGTRDRGIFTFLLLGTYLACHMLILILFILNRPVWALAGIVIITAFDVLIFLKSLAGIRQLYMICWIIPYKLYALIYPWLFLPALLFNKKVQWKSDHY